MSALLCGLVCFLSIAKISPSHCFSGYWNSSIFPSYFFVWLFSLSLSSLDIVQSESLLNQSKWHIYIQNKGIFHALFLIFLYIHTYYYILFTWSWKHKYSSLLSSGHALWLKSTHKNVGIYYFICIFTLKYLCLFLIYFSYSAVISSWMLMSRKAKRTTWT